MEGEIVFFDPGKATNGLWKAAMFPDGTRVNLSPDKDPREVFADWLVDPKNPWFTRNIAKPRLVVAARARHIQEPDDIRPGNPPSNPKLLLFWGMN